MLITKPYNQSANIQLWAEAIVVSVESMRIYYQSKQTNSLARGFASAQWLRRCDWRDRQGSRHLVEISGGTPKTSDFTDNTEPQSSPPSPIVLFSPAISTVCYGHFDSLKQILPYFLCIAGEMLA